MTRDWARLGRELKDARITLELGQQDVADRIGVRRGALHNIERGQISKITPTVLAYARTVHWTEGSVSAVLDGGTPVERVDDPPDRDRDAADLSILVRQSLKEGPLVDARVAEVTTPTGKLTATIVIRGEHGAAQEELLASLRKLKIEIEVKD